jgi:hypothetical protein
VLAGLLVLFVLLLNMLAAASALHERFHSDAGQSGHVCAATLFAHGQVDSPVVDVLVPLAAPVVLDLLMPASVPALPLMETLPPGRAPPVSSSNS